MAKEVQMPEAGCKWEGHYSDWDELLDVWTQHFSSLSKSRAEEIPEQLVHREKIASLAIQSIRNKEYLLDIPFSVEEVKHGVGKLKKGKAASPDSILAEYLIAGGDAVVLWLKGIMTECYG